MGGRLSDRGPIKAPFCSLGDPFTPQLFAFYLPPFDAEDTLLFSSYVFNTFATLSPPASENPEESRS